MIHYTNTTSYDYSGRKRKKRKAKGEVYEKFTPSFRPLTAPLYSYRSNRDQYPSFDSGRMNVEKKENDEKKDRYPFKHFSPYNGAMTRSICYILVKIEHIYPFRNKSAFSPYL